MQTQFTALASRQATIFDMPCFAGGEWRPKRTGDYATDCATGRAIGQEIVDLVQASGNRLITGAAARMIVRGAMWDGVEVGFFHVIGKAIE